MKLSSASPNLLFTLLCWITVAPAQAQRNAVPEPARAASAAVAVSAASQPATLQRVQISGSTAADGDGAERRQSTAAKIIVGRDEIERFGDSNLGDVLKRLPGVTTSGSPGRRGGPRMRGLGGGYTQLLINGEQIPAGFSLESLTPEQVERIEILRAPTAEYGARAIAGTINIVLREALRRRLNDLQLGSGFEAGRASPRLSWTRNDRLGDSASDSYNLSVTAFRRDREDIIDSRTTVTEIERSDARLAQQESGADRDRREGINISGRLQWRFGSGDSLSLQPFMFASRAIGNGQRHLEQPTGATPPSHADAAIASDSDYRVARINAQWQQALGAGDKLELRLGAGGFDSHSDSRRRETDSSGRTVRRLDEQASARERSASSVGKLSRELASQHSLVGGWELDRIRRSEQRSTLQDGLPLLPGFDPEVDASSTRLALYAQDEWSPNKQWSAYAGLRWEQITTRSIDASSPVQQRSAIWTPLLQAVWRPDEKSRDQLRVALTRSYKSPTLRNLIARPSLSTRFPPPLDNQPTSPDSIGNPQLRPELATGVDLAFEHYLPAGGLLSVNLFHRQISDLIRNVTRLQKVPGLSSQERFVSQPRNVGDAVTQGIELEAKGRLNEFGGDLPAVAVRSNLSLFRSRVDGVPGPDNRIDEQPSATANLGADYRWRGLPLAIGGSLNWTPAYVVQQSANQQRSSGVKRSFEAFATWTFDPSLTLRISANDLAPLDYTTANRIDSGDLRERTVNRSTTRTQWNLRLEFKL